MRIGMRSGRLPDVIVTFLGSVLLTGALVIPRVGPDYRVPSAAGDVPPAFDVNGLSWTATVRINALPRPKKPLPAPGRLQLAAPKHADEPVSLTIPSQVIGGTVVPVDFDATRELGVPSDPAVLGWWAGGARPGAAYGTVVIDGHVDTRAGGKGVLFDLEQVEPGQRIQVLTSHGVVTYEAQARRSYPKAELPEEIFSTTGTARLVLITCGGPFDEKTRHYAYNIVVYAVPV